MTAPALPRQSQWDVVARQFRKNRPAVWGFRVTLALVFLAIYAPVLASGHPFLWREPGGSLESPWLSRLFDVISWEHGVDRFFNSVMITLTLYGLLRLGMQLGIREREKRRTAVRAFRKWFVGAAVVVAFLQASGMALVTSLPAIDYRVQEQKVLEEQADARSSLEATERLLAAEKDPAKKAALEADRGELRGRIEHLASFLVFMTPIPYGHREQLPGVEDKFLGTLSFERGGRHLLGTDEVGRDVFARILYGTRISLTIGIIAVAIYGTIGTILGAFAGYFGGRVDLGIMRVVEVVICIPGLFLILAIVAFFEERSIFLVMLAIGLVGWTSITRLVRGEFLRERAKDYVSAARAMGLSTRRIVFRHILPNAMAPVLVAATFGVASAIMAESTLAFLGLGDVTVPSWGRVLDDGRVHQYWHLIIPPSVAIFLTMTALNLVGDGLRDALDPKLRN